MLFSPNDVFISSRFNILVCNARRLKDTSDMKWVSRLSQRSVPAGNYMVVGKWVNAGRVVGLAGKCRSGISPPYSFHIQGQNQ